MSAEPAMIVNGVTLSEGQAMTVRVALQNFAGTLMQDGLGEDDHGKSMAKAYLDRIGEINILMAIWPRA